MLFAPSMQNRFYLSLIFYQQLQAKQNKQRVRSLHQAEPVSSSRAELANNFAKTLRSAPEAGKLAAHDAQRLGPAGHDAGDEPVLLGGELLELAADGSRLLLVVLRLLREGRRGGLVGIGSRCGRTGGADGRGDGDLAVGCGRSAGDGQVVSLRNGRGSSSGRGLGFGIGGAHLDLRADGRKRMADGCGVVVGRDGVASERVVGNTQA